MSSMHGPLLRFRSRVCWAHPRARRAPTAIVPWGALLIWTFKAGGPSLPPCCQHEATGGTHLPGTSTQDGQERRQAAHTKRRRSHAQVWLSVGVRHGMASSPSETQLWVSAMPGLGRFRAAAIAIAALAVLSRADQAFLWDQWQTCICHHGGESCDRGAQV